MISFLTMILGEQKMWVITVYSTDESIKMFEYESELEAKESLQSMKGRSILSHVVYFNDYLVETVAN